MLSQECQQAIHCLHCPYRESFGYIIAKAIGLTHLTSAEDHGAGGDLDLGARFSIDNGLAPVLLGNIGCSGMKSKLYSSWQLEPVLVFDIIMTLQLTGIMVLSETRSKL